MNKVTVQEVVDALNAYGAELEKVGFKKCASPTLPERIQQHGIEVAYTPMQTQVMLLSALWECYKHSGADTDGDNGWHCTPEQAAKSAVESVKQLRDDYNEALREEPTLDQAKRICEEAGLAVVPREPTQKILSAIGTRMITNEKGAVRLYADIVEATKDKP